VVETDCTCACLIVFEWVPRCVCIYLFVFVCVFFRICIRVFVGLCAKKNLTPVAGSILGPFPRLTFLNEFS